jgi:phage terminase large subunit-like protein
LSGVKIEVPDKMTFFFQDGYVRYRVAYGGRASGKSWAAVRGLIVKSLQKKRRILCCREFQNSIADSIKHTLEENIELLGLSAYFNSTKEGITCTNGSQFIFRGLHNNVSEIKSLENISIAYVEEAENVSEESWQTLIPTIRADESEIWAVFNPKREEAATYQRFVLFPPKNAIVAKVNYVDNPFCPSVMIEEAENLREKNLAMYRHIWLGECRKSDENALWKYAAMIQPYRVKQCPADLERLVIGVDPAVTSADTSDLTGIVAAGSARNPKTGELEYYVLDDRSLKASPNEWAKAVIALYVDLDADRVVVETNNGGDLVASLLRNIDPSVSLTAVRATRGKILRAEPIAALYERGLVHHVGEFPALEDQMCSFTGDPKEKSPDRLDALVWALTELACGANAEPEVGNIALSY